MTGRVLLLRHGQTEWAATGRHTGRTDVPLDAVGEQQARALLGALPDDVPVLCSPLQRARRTAELAGLTDVQVDPDLLEWDYGGYEGLTTAQIRERTGQPDWEIFRCGVVPGDTPGEQLADVAARAERVVTRVRELTTDSDVILVGHGHTLRILGACWVQAEPSFGAHLALDPASVSVLGALHDVPTLQQWNLRSPELSSHQGADSPTGG